jgi:arginase
MTTDPERLFDTLKPGMVTLAGFPRDENSSFMRGAALAPPRIREALFSGSSNLCAENGTDLGAEPRFRDIGDFEQGPDTAGFESIEKTVTLLLDRGVHVLSLGGDHAVTYPILRAYAVKYGDLDLLYLDAHPDLYDTYEGNRLSHACPAARIMEENLVRRLVQVGIRGMNPHQREQAERFGVEVMDMRSRRPDLDVNLEGPVYLSLDMDVLDPAFAPGVSHREPGGLSTREVIRLIQGLPGPLVGADIVEFNPKQDPAGITAVAAAKLLKEIAGKMIASTP